MNQHFDAIVVGTGGVGSATLFKLAERGCRVLGIDRFPPGHDRGSSHGETRVIRRAYFEHPDYVPLLNRAYESWNDHQHRVGRQLLFQPGLIEVGPPEGEIIPGLRQAADRHDLPLEEIDGAQFQERFPGFVLPDGYTALFESDGGYLLVEECIRTYCEQAQQLGAELATGEAVCSWRQMPGHVEVKTDTNTYLADRLVIAGGAWSHSLLKDLNIGLQVHRKHLHWIERNDDVYRADQGSPVFFYETPAGFYYGFPEIDGQGVKLAEHGTVEIGTDDIVIDPLKVSQDVDPQELARIQLFLRNYMPSVGSKSLRHDVCMYTMTSDQHFVLDTHPEYERVAFAAGLSGHGFKFASVLGEVLADLAVDGQTALPIEFLSSCREGLH